MMHVKPLVVSLVLMASVLAGCADDSSVPAVDEAVTSTGFTLRGVVVDESIVPIADATVGLAPLGLTAASDDNGEFAFLDIEPGTYTLTTTHEQYIETVAIATVRADGTSAVVKLVMPFNTELVRYFQEYHFQGFYECGVPLGDDITCSNVNIISWIILGQENITTDRSLFLQWIDGIPDFLQTELVWESTQQFGDNLGFAVGGATEEQLSTGQATTHNYSFGPSPIMLTIPGPELKESGIGADRALLAQVFAAPYEDIPGGCLVYNPCGPGLQLMQDFETFTHTFYGYKPPPGWLFSRDSSPELPP